MAFDGMSNSLTLFGLRIRLNIGSSSNEGPTGIYNYKA